MYEGVTPRAGRITASSEVISETMSSWPSEGREAWVYLEQGERGGYLAGHGLSSEVVAGWWGMYVRMRGDLVSLIPHAL
jgi:hypothetical protein